MSADDLAVVIQLFGIAITLLLNFLLLGVLLYIYLFRPWLKIRAEGVSLDFMDYVRMIHEGVNTKLLFESVRQAKQAGLTIPFKKLEKALARGADLDAILVVMRDRQRKGQPVNFDELVRMDLRGGIHQAML